VSLVRSLSPAHDTAGRLRARLADLEAAFGERVAEITRRKADLAAIQHATDLAALRESPMHQMKAMVDEAAARGKDLIADMVRRLQRDILIERNRLDALRWRP